MFGIFGKKVKEVKKEVVKLENRKLMRAGINIAFLVAFSDGDCEEAELKKLAQVIEALPEFSHFGSEIGKTIEHVKKTFSVGFTLGKLTAMDEIRDLEADEKEKRVCFAIGIEIASADGEMEPQELAILKEVAQALGISLAEFGLE